MTDWSPLTSVGTTSMDGQLRRLRRVSRSQSIPFPTPNIHSSGRQYICFTTYIIPYLFFYFSIYNFFKKKNVGLKRLNISFNGFGREGSQGLALVLKKNRTLRELDLSYNRMVDEDIRVIAKGLTENDTLKTLVVITKIFISILYTT